PPVDELGAGLGQAFVTHPGGLAPRQREAELVVLAGLERVDDPPGEGAGQVVDHDQLSVHGVNTKGCHWASTTEAASARSQTGSRRRWVRARASDQPSESSGRASTSSWCGPPSTITPALTTRSPSALASPNRAVRPPAVACSTTCTWRSSPRWMWAGGVPSRDASHPASRWRGPRLPATSMSVTPAAKGRYAGPLNRAASNSR